MNLVSLLARCPPLANMPLKAVTDLARMLQPRLLELGDSLFEPGDPAETFHLLLSGRLLLTARDGRQVSKVNAGEFLGATALLLPSTHNVSAVAIEDSEVVSISRTFMEELWDQAPPVAAAVEMSFATHVMVDLARANEDLVSQLNFPISDIRHTGLRLLLSGQGFTD